MDDCRINRHSIFSFELRFLARSQRRLTLLLSEGLTLQTEEERRALPMYVTYADLIQLLIFIVALVGLVYEIFKDRRK